MPKVRSFSTENHVNRQSNEISADASHDAGRRDVNNQPDEITSSVNDIHDHPDQIGEHHDVRPEAEHWI